MTDEFRSGRFARVNRRLRREEDESDSVDLLATSNEDPMDSTYIVSLDSAGNVVMYTPPGQNGNQFGLLLGRPVIPVEYCPVLGTPGDIILADLSQYIVIDRGTPSTNQSIHVRYLSFEDTFRFTYRTDGQPVWKKPVTPKNGSNLQAPFTYLAARS